MLGFDAWSDANEDMPQLGKRTKSSIALTDKRPKKMQKTNDALGFGLCFDDDEPPKTARVEQIKARSVRAATSKARSEAPVSVNASKSKMSVAKKSPGKPSPSKSKLSVKASVKDKASKS